MILKVGINGFGRVGRVVFRTCLEHPDVEVCAINDPAIEINYICYLLKYDSTHGTLKSNISHTENEIIIDDLHVKVFQQKFPTDIPWHMAGVQYIVEASGMFTNLDKASGHLTCDGVRRVIVTAPCVDVPMVILGVNEKQIKLSSKVISCGSSTLYCLAPIIKVLEDNYGVEEGFITSIHAMTPSLKPLDGLCLKGKHWRDHRSITQNIIPAATGACKALGRIIPSVKDRMCGLAFRVPIANVSVLDLTVKLKKFTSIEHIVGDIEKFNDTTRNIIKTSSDEAVSSDFIGDSYSCILDINSSIQLKANSLKLICWYENEYSYACRVIDLIIYSENQFNESNSRRNQTTCFTSEPLDINQLKGTAPIDRAIKGKIKTNYSQPIHVKIQPQVGLKKPIVNPMISFNSGPDGGVMVCKIWNDGETIMRHKPTAFFQPSSSFPKPPVNESFCIEAKERLNYLKQDAICNRAQERLLKVKQEFSKMVNITESLLKKSYNSKLNLNAVQSGNDVTNKSKHSENTNSTTLEAVENYMSYNSSNCDIRNMSSKMSTSTLNSKNVLGNSSIDQRDNIASDKDKSDFSMMTIESEAKRAEIKGDELANIKNSVVTKTHTGTFNSLPYLERKISECIGDTEENEECHENKRSSENLNDPNENNGKAETQPLSITKTDTNNEQRTELKDNVQNVNDAVGNITEDVENLEPNSRSDDQIQTEQNQNDETEKEDVLGGQLDIKGDQLCAGHVTTAASDGSKHGVEQIEGISLAEVTKSNFVDDAPWTSRPHYKNKQDIYDKLDSVSGSNNSFDIEKKKSEVINITDLTKSLEDLDRLDKICRIMEISDELSDKLFSALNNCSEESNVNITKKRWSFKDLCEKVNLDEFCNKVFGK